MSLLDNTINQIKNEIQVDSKGDVKFSIRAAARLSDVSPSTLIEQFKDSSVNPSKLAQKLSENGFNPVNFATTGIPDIAMALIVEYYAFDAGSNCKNQAILVYRAFSSLGIRSWAQKLLGWQPPNIYLSLIESLEQLHVKIDAQVEEIKLLRPAHEKLNKIETVLSDFPGLKQALDYLIANINKPNQSQFTLSQWLEEQDLSYLPKGIRIRIGQMVNNWVKLSSLKEIEQKWATGTKTYNESFEPLLKIALRYSLSI